MEENGQWYFFDFNKGGFKPQSLVPSDILIEVDPILYMNNEKHIKFKELLHNWLVEDIYNLPE